MNDWRVQIKKGIARGMGFSLVVLPATTVSLLIAQSVHTFSAGDVVSSNQINENFQIAAPQNGIMAFYQSVCPNGWIAADGTNGTPDLRGQFIRGLNDFGSAAGTRSDGSEDPDGSGRAPGDSQNDNFANHNHGGGNHSHRIWGDVEATFDGGGRLPTAQQSGLEHWISTEGPSATVVNFEGGNETRPKNTALIFCMRVDQ